jgi:hypothetical protein
MISVNADLLIAAIVGLLGLIGGITAGVIAFFQSRSSVKQADINALSGIITELREQVDSQGERIQQLEELNEDFESWAESLCNQIRDLGMVPVKFIRRKRQMASSTDRKTKPRKLEE